MTQNNEREAFEKPEYWDEFESWWETYGQYCRAGGSNYEKSFAWAAFEYLKSQSPISQNEQQEAVAYTDGEGDFITKEMYDEYLKLGFYTECIVPLYNSPHKQIPDGGNLIGKVSEMGVVWHKQNPHAHPVGTEFYAVLPTASLTSETNTEVRE